LYTENTVNELTSSLVTRMACFDTRFGCYRFLKSGYSAEQILDRLDIQVLDQFFRLQEERNMQRFEYRFCR
jgi:polyphosphate kinase 2 (PPK2 family)